MRYQCACGARGIQDALWHRGRGDPYVYRTNSSWYTDSAIVWTVADPKDSTKRLLAGIEIATGKSLPVSCIRCRLAYERDRCDDRKADDATAKANRKPWWKLW